MIGEPSADLVFDPTLAIWKVALRCCALTYFSRIYTRMDLHLDRTMLPAALDGLRGPLCLRLASACNHRPEGINLRHYKTPGTKRQEEIFLLDQFSALSRKKIGFP